ncbi:hypothetical protein GYMC10_3168 [Paenibacillus sp. Y412MC10]|nr:hypothetical protein GYMC10_3168 [Paenibacillus sp. Y412MC10]
MTQSLPFWSELMTLSPPFGMILSLLAYDSASMLLLVVTCKNFASNIKAYHS